MYISFQIGKYLIDAKTESYDIDVLQVLRKRMYGAFSSYLGEENCLSCRMETGVY
jgi:hypothetical protein